MVTKKKSLAMAVVGGRGLAAVWQLLSMPSSARWINQKCFSTAEELWIVKARS